jgi:hypothetical protein
VSKRKKELSASTYRWREEILTQCFTLNPKCS